MPRAWKLYRYSLLYLFLLFLAMPIDRYVAPVWTHGPADTVTIVEALGR